MWSRAQCPRPRRSSYIDSMRWSNPPGTRARPRCLRATFLHVSCAAFLSTGLGAQSGGHWFDVEARSDALRPISVSQDPPAPHAVSAVAAALGSAGGLLAGAYAGYRIERRWSPCECDDPGLAGAILGSLVGPALVAPVAAHLFNGRRGKVVVAYGAAAAIAGVGFLGSRSLDTRAGVFFVLTPIAQAASAVLIEIATER